ncbi:CDP-glucose 4,6-dehydratase [Spiribacter sp. 1M153]|uniref:CDP-glucose 4,6-dehydratase n=1 Tax=Spiribacter roseus TaxID=1855875 RepID=UPI00349FCF2A
MRGNEQVSSLETQLRKAYEGKTVLVTGHTGFKGSWMSEWLLMLGARMVGIALPPDTDPALFDQLGLAERLEHHIVDIRDRQALKTRVLEAQPDFIFHLAAQPLVRRSYAEPVETWDANVMGTIHLLDALRELDQRYAQSDKTCASVFITTDKCYENREWLYGYRESDPLGGYDPYSASKAAAELAIAAYRRSFFPVESVTTAPRIGIASARAGNVIGGGDWAPDRIVPDCIRHLNGGDSVPVRNPAATRPWQHVLEPLGGYLQLAARQRQALESQDPAAVQATCAAYNFGPELTANQPVSALVEQLLQHWPGRWTDQSDCSDPHEAGLLNLAWDKAYQQLGWRPRWDFATTVERTVGWYRRQIADQVDALTLVQGDIAGYQGHQISLS